MSTEAIADENAPDYSGMAVSAMHAVADGLTDHGLDIRGPAWEKTHHFNVINVPGALCELVIGENGSVTWEYRPIWDCRVDPAQVTAMILELLGASPAREGAAPACGYRGRTLMGAVGRAVRASGMRTHLSIVGQDDADCEVYSEVEMSNPAQPGRGTAWVSQDNAVRWECRFIDLVQGTQTFAPTDIAETIARSLPRDATLPPALAG
jgi:hypothetical protein